MIDSVRLRLTFWHVTVLALLLIGFSFTVYAVLSSTLYGRVDAVLSSVVDGTVSMLDKESSEKKVALLAPGHALKALSFPDTSLAIFDPAGALIAEKAAGRIHRVPPPAIPGLALNERHKYTVVLEPGSGGVFRAAAVQINTLPLNTNYIIVASQSLEPVLRELETLRRILYAAVPGVLLLAGLGGWFLARKSLAPVVAMSEHARRIGAENLQERLPVVNSRDELGRLALTFNELLARVNAAFSQQRQFMADASHELRTPVSVIQTAASVALDSEHREEADYRSLLTTIEAQVRRLSRIVEDLFRLARADSGHYVLQPRGFYLDELLTETARAARFLAGPKGISIEIPALPEVPYHGDEELLRQMISNLIDNSIKYTPPGGSVQLGLEVSGREYVIAISDSGPGIPPEAQPYIFERFFRADEAHSNGDHNGSGGAGLGLSIARWVAEAHQGHVELEHSSELGSTFVACLPVLQRNA
jgi:two-component system, OmpR family, sensor kinase